MATAAIRPGAWATRTSRAAAAAVPAPARRAAAPLQPPHRRGRRAPQQPATVTAASSSSSASAAASADAPLPIPRGPQETVAQAVAAVSRAWEAGVQRQRVELLLPLIGATDLDDWPGGIRQQFKAAQVRQGRAGGRCWRGAAWQASGRLCLPPHCPTAAPAQPPPPPPAPCDSRWLRSCCAR